MSNEYFKKMGLKPYTEKNIDYKNNCSIDTRNIINMNKKYNFPIPINDYLLITGINSNYVTILDLLPDEEFDEPQELKLFFNSQNLEGKSSNEDLIDKNTLRLIKRSLKRA